MAANPAASSNQLEINLPARTGHPVVACTEAELDRLRAAWKVEGPAHEAVNDLVQRADRALQKPLVFPPRGGQHNQWYQCEPCQIGLQTVDESHHRCPQCGTVYSGEPYDDVLFARTHDQNLENMASAAWAYAITGREPYAELARQVLLGYAQRYRQYPYHTASRKLSLTGGHLAEQTLNEAADLVRWIAPAYDLMYSRLSDQERQTIESGLVLPMLQNLDRNKAATSNWQTWHNAAMLWGGAVLGDAGWVRKALADPQNGFAFQMINCTSQEGMWYENSWGYHFYTLQALVQTAEGARRLGIDLWSHPVLKRMVLLPAAYVMPDGKLPRFGDDTSVSLRGQAWAFEAAWRAYREPALAALLPNKPTWDSVLLGREAEATQTPAIAAPESVVFPHAGHAILRASGPAAPAAAITFGPYGGFHGHFDKLSFVFYAYDRELGVDPGRALSQAYRLPIHQQWYKATASHNAVLVDGQSQAAAAGALELFEKTEHFTAAAAVCTEAYPGVRHRRLLCMTPSYLLVVDDLVADKPRRFDWLYHHRATTTVCSDAADAQPLPEGFAGAEYLHNLRSGRSEQAISVRFEAAPGTTHLTMAAGGPTMLWTADGPGASVLDRVPMVILSRQGDRATFAAVLEPAAGQAQATVTDVRCESAAGSVRIRLPAGNRTDEFIWRQGKLEASRHDR